MKTIYTELSELNDLQKKVINAIDEWAHKEKKPIPLKEIIKRMQKNKVEKYSTIYALKILIKKGYIRRGFEISNKTTFVQLRRI